MIRQLLSIATTEALLARRTWRFWLTVALLLGILYLTWRDHVAFVEADMFLAPDHSFGNRPIHSEYIGRERISIHRVLPNYAASMSIAVTWMAGVALALDCCGRLARTGMDKILFPRPFTTMTFVLGRYLGILLIMVPLSAIPWVGFGLVQTIYGHADVVWQPFILCYLFLVLPVLLPLVALALWLRLVIKHDIAAVVIMLVMTFVYLQAGRDAVQGLSQNWRTFVLSSPSLGASLDLADQWPILFVHGLFIIAFLLFAPFHLRRREPQRRVVRRRGHRWFSIPTFLRWFSDLKIDRNVPLAVKLVAFLCLILMGGGGVFAVLQGREKIRESATVGKALESLRRHPPPATPYDVLSYDIEVSPDFKRDRITSSSTVRICSATDDLTVARFYLNREMNVRELSGAEGPLEYAADMHILSVTLPKPLLMGEPFEFRLEAQGPRSVFVGRWGVHAVHPDFGVLGSGEWWYPAQYVPRIQTGERVVSIAKPDLFDATVAVTLPAGSHLVFPGEAISNEELGNVHRVTYRTSNPVGGLQLLWGKYSSIDAEFAGIPCRFFHLPGHRYQAQVFLEEMKDSQAAVREKLGSLPFPRVTVCEIPLYRFIAGPSMAGLLPVKEDNLMYLHEGIWTLDRYDTKPSEVPFYQMLQGIVRFLNWEYRAFLVTTYFDKTFQSNWTYAFWLDEHLSSYISKALEPNAWRRRFLFNYDAGLRGNPAPSIVARPLRNLRKEQSDARAERMRGEGIFRMLHHLLGDDGWWTFVRRLLEEYRFKDVSDPDVIQLVNEVSEEPLDWFFGQWLYGDVLPCYEITLAEATVVRKPRSIQVEYNVRVKVKNHGTGRTAVPIYVETDRDHILRDVWLDTGQEKTLTMVVPHRPMFAMVDPENWVLQEPLYDEESKKRRHSERKFDVLQPSEREERGKRLAVSAKGNTSQ